MPARKLICALALSMALLGCGSGGGGNNTVSSPGPGAGVVQGSSGSASSSMAVYTEQGVTYAGVAGAGQAKLLTIPNTGGMAAGVRVVTGVSAATISTPLADVSGVALDPANDVGVAYGYDSELVSIFRISTGQQLYLYNTQTANIMPYPGARDTRISGIVMDSAARIMIIATADGFEMVDYTDPTRPVQKMEVVSTEVDSVNGVEVIENFAYDRDLSIGGEAYRMVLTGGKGWGPHALVLLDASTGDVYRPDAATDDLFVVDDYIDAAAVDTSYHVAILADEGVGTTFVDLNKLTFDKAAKTYSLPMDAVSRIDTYSEFANLAIDSAMHMVMMGQESYPAKSIVVAELKNPADGLGFAREAQVSMPDGTDDTGASVTWSGAIDPHGAAAYVTGSSNPSYPAQASMGVWANSGNTHIAVINLKNVLDGALSGQPYDPLAQDPQKDISYMNIP